MCGPHCHFAPLLTHTLRRIPQAVGVVATDLEPLTVWEVAERVSIPQAVGVVATF